jgi:hypothetical protein
MAKLLNNKGILQSIYPIITGLVSIGVLLGVGLLIMNKFANSDTTVNGNTINNTNFTLGMAEVISSTRTISQTWLPIIVIVSMAGLILVLVMKGFSFGVKGGAK